MSAEPRPAFGAVPAAAVIAELLRVQHDVPERTPVARFFGRSPLSDESRRWYLGALGEIEVARRMDALGEGWTVLHSVPVGTRGSDIDHVVIGRAGVFTVNTKHHDGARVWVGRRKLLVNGQPTDHLRNAGYEATRVHELLSSAGGLVVPVTGLVVIVGARDITIRERPDHVTVLRSQALIRWLQRQKPQLDDETVARIVTTASRTDTWTFETPRPADGSAFAALQSEVTRASRVRMLWGAAAFVVLLGVAAPTAIDFYTRTFGG
ncbi:NERD domain-containing protein [Microbacterium sp. W1N]|uniref:nuclease-related domain-containing protein n=1 Tax=Microbacterium festucae TaxID=2977531 RepID=UPI0021BE1BA6|nr:nuclease-related domain-containing protein [Microbacterium festucae]MCT9821138.1 NERD domain-containing protein [Microbacterium festucae]